ncbi:Paramecium surface antigen domain [Porphyromonas gingivalis AJW4]|nr:Paramecium surface antigen domain [Porphyromonas gingivalis AJW4]
MIVGCFLLPARCRTRLSADSCFLHDAGHDCQLILASCTMQDAIVSCFLLPARCGTRLSADSCFLHDAGRDCQLILASCTMQDAIVN